jgi:hypothetical protein
LQTIKYHYINIKNLYKIIIFIKIKNKKKYFFYLKMAYSEKIISWGGILLAVIALIFAVWAFVRSNDTDKDSVESEDIIDGSVTLAKLANNSVNQDKIVDNYFLNDGMRYFFEFFQKPVVTAATAAYSVAAETPDVLVAAMETAGITTYNDSTSSYVISNNLQGVINSNFTLLGASAASATGGLVTEKKGLILATGTTAANQAIAFSNVGWADTSAMFDFTTIISIPTISTVVTFAGLKIAATPLLATDIVSAYFFYASVATVVAGSDVTGYQNKLCFAYSSATGSNEYVSILPLTIVAGSDYKLRIKCDSSRQLSIFVNDVQYNVNSTTVGVAAGVAVTTGTSKSLALTADTRLRAIVGVHNLASDTTARTLECRYMKCINSWTPA